MSLGVSDNVLLEAHNDGGQNSEAHNDGGQNSQHPKLMARKMLLGNRFYCIKVFFWTIISMPLLA